MEEARRVVDRRLVEWQFASGNETAGTKVWVVP